MTTATATHWHTIWHTIISGGNADGEVSEPLANEAAALERANWLVGNLLADEPEEYTKVEGSVSDPNGAVLTFYDGAMQVLMHIEVIALACDGDGCPAFDE